jgi:hypothetical protein
MKQLLLFQANTEITILITGINYHLICQHNHIVLDAHVGVELDGSLDEWVGQSVGVSVVSV